MFNARAELTSELLGHAQTMPERQFRASRSSWQAGRAECVYYMASAALIWGLTALTCLPPPAGGGRPLRRRLATQAPVGEVGEEVAEYELESPTAR